MNRRAAVPAGRLRPLLAARVRLASGVVLDREAAVCWVPRRGRVERWVARRLHRGEERVRVRLDDRAVQVLAAVADGGDVAVAELARRVAVPLPDPAERGEAWPAEAVSLLVFLDSLARSRVLVTEPI